MATRNFEGTEYDITKVFDGECSNCGGGVCVGWAIYKKGTINRESTFCYTCTWNKWNKAFALFKQSKAK